MKSVAFAWVITIWAAAASAQSPPPAPPPAAAPSVAAGFQDGFFVQSADGNNRLVLGMLAQLDGRFTVDDPSPVTDSFTIRKLRPTFTGRVARYFEFKVMPDFGGGSVSVQDAYLDLRFSPRLRLRMGKDKTPVGYEFLQGDGFVLFPERAIASGLVPNRDIGLQLQGDLNPRVSYAAGIFNGVPDGAAASTDVDANNGKDLAGRVVVQPFRRPGPVVGSLAGLGFQLGGSRGSEAGALPSFRTSVGQTYFSYTSGAAADGLRTRVSPAAFFYRGPFGAFTEFVRSTQRVSRGTASRDLTNSAWEATGSWVLTGEAASDRGVRPRQPFDPSTRRWGALQALARYSSLRIDRQAITSGLAAAGASRGANQVSLGLNWYPVAAVKYYLAYERTGFEPGAGPRRPVEHSVTLRGQLAF